MRDPIKAKAWKQQYLLKKKIEKYGPESANVCMIGRHGNHARGPRNGRWNTGSLISSQGYVLNRVPLGHHRGFGPPGCKHMYAYEHDLVAEKMLGRRLEDNEVVHHKNGQRGDNRPGNLIVTTRSDHAREHADFPGARNALGRFTDAIRSGDEWPEDLRVREIPI